MGEIPTDAAEPGPRERSDSGDRDAEADSSDEGRRCGSDEADIRAYKDLGRAVAAAPAQGRGRGLGAAREGQCPGHVWACETGCDAA